MGCVSSRATHTEVLADAFGIVVEQEKKVVLQENKGADRTDCARLSRQLNFTTDEVESLQVHYAALRDQYLDGEGGSQELLWEFMMNAEDTTPCSGVSPDIVGALCEWVSPDEVLTFPVCIQVLSTFSRGSSEEQLTYLFCLFDADNSGYILHNDIGILVDMYNWAAVATDQEEMQKKEQRLRRLREQLIAVVDPNEEGKVSYTALISNCEFISSQLNIPDALGSMNREMSPRHQQAETFTRSALSRRVRRSLHVSKLFRMGVRRSSNASVPTRRSSHTSGNVRRSSGTSSGWGVPSLPGQEVESDAAGAPPTTTTTEDEGASPRSVPQVGEGSDEEDEELSRTLPNAIPFADDMEFQPRLTQTAKQMGFKEMMRMRSEMLSGNFTQADGGLSLTDDDSKTFLIDKAGQRPGTAGGARRTSLSTLPRGGDDEAYDPLVSSFLGSISDGSQMLTPRHHVPPPAPPDLDALALPMQRLDSSFGIDSVTGLFSPPFLSSKKSIEKAGDRDAGFDSGNMRPSMKKRSRKGVRVEGRYNLGEDVLAGIGPKVASFDFPTPTDDSMQPPPLLGSSSSDQRSLSPDNSLSPPTSPARRRSRVKSSVVASCESLEIPPLQLPLPLHKAVHLSPDVEVRSRGGSTTSSGFVSLTDPQS